MRGPRPPEAAALTGETEALVARYRALTRAVREQSGIFADQLRLSAWAMQLRSSGLAMLRAGRITASNVAFNRLCRTVPVPLLSDPSPLDRQGRRPQRFSTLRRLIVSEACLFAQAAKSGPVRHRYRTSGRDCWIDVLFDRLPDDEAGEVVAAMVQDVTAQARGAAALMAAEAALARQERLRAIGQLAAGVAHDVSNTLGAIRLRLSALSRDAACMRTQGPNVEALGRIVRDGALMLQRLQRLGHYDDRREPEPLDLAESISSAVEIARSGLRYRALHDAVDIRIECHIPSLPSITAWRDDLQRVFVNVLINARDAMLMGGCIRVRGRREGERIVVVIEDEGTGIHPAILPRIFEPYFTTKGGNGTGMGLATAQQAMARLGGTITAENRVGGGAEFTLCFPLAPASVLAPRRGRARRGLLLNPPD